MIDDANNDREFLEKCLSGEVDADDAAPEVAAPDPLVVCCERWHWAGQPDWDWFVSLAPEDQDALALAGQSVFTQKAIVTAKANAGMHAELLAPFDGGAALLEQMLHEVAARAARDMQEKLGRN